MKEVTRMDKLKVLSYGGLAIGLIGNGINAVANNTIELNKTVDPETKAKIIAIFANTFKGKQ